eukprot:COSAG04_NODE_15598_length_527_cov_0.530374_1_plen_45_part_10
MHAECGLTVPGAEDPIARQHRERARVDLVRAVQLGDRILWCGARA